MPFAGVIAAIRAMRFGLLQKVTPKGGNVPRAEVARRRKREKARRATQARNR
jgi:hypothetical protein